MDAIDKIVRCCVCTCALLGVLLHVGCASSEKSVLTPPTLAPMPVYPAEKEGWDTSVPLLVYPLNGSLGIYAEAVKSELAKRGYRIIGTSTNGMDWLSPGDRTRIKQVTVSSFIGKGSLIYQKNNTSDMCLQVAVVNPVTSGRAVLPQEEDVRYFHVWSRREHLGQLMWNEVYPLHATQLASNLMCLPSFRAALQPQKSVRSDNGNGQTASGSSPGEHSDSDVMDKKMRELVSGTWENTVTCTVLTKSGRAPAKTETSTLDHRWTFRANGLFKAEVRQNDISYVAEGIWAIKNGRLIIDSTDRIIPGLALGSRELSWISKDEISVRADSERSFQGPDGENIALHPKVRYKRSCSYVSENAMRLVFDGGPNFRVEKTLSIPPMKRSINP